jgi:hypothetical protein
MRQSCLKQENEAVQRGVGVGVRMRSDVRSLNATLAKSGVAFFSTDFRGGGPTTSRSRSAFFSILCLQLQLILDCSMHSISCSGAHINGRAHRLCGCQASSTRSYQLDVHQHRVNFQLRNILQPPPFYHLQQRLQPLQYHGLSAY